MQTKKAITIITAILLIILIPSSLAAFEIVSQESPNNTQSAQNNFVITQYSLTKDFGLYSKNPEINICSCSAFLDSLTLQNTGNQKDTYEIFSSLDYSRLSINRITLEPGQKVEIINYITPGCDEFSDEMAISAVSSGGNSKKLSQAVNTVLCSNINSNMQNSTLKTYPCTPVSGKFIVKNPLSFPEIYHFSSDILKDSVTFSENPANITGGKTKQINFTYSPPCSVYGDFKGNIIIDTEYTGLTQSVPLNISVQKRYRFDAVSPLVFETCNNFETWIPITIKNYENFENTFKVTMQKNKYFKIQNDTIGILPNSQNIAYIIAKPEWKDEGIIYLQYTVASALGDMETAKYVIANVSNCHKFNVITDEETICSDDIAFFTLQNTGTKRGNFSVEADGVKLNNKISIEPNNTVEIPVHLNITDEDKAYSLNLKVSDGYNQKNAKIKLNIRSLHSCFDALIDIKDVNVNFKGAIDNITVKNNGIRKGKYTASIDAPSWALINKENLNLSVNQYSAISLITMPGNISGDFKATLTLKEKVSGQNYTKSFTIMANEKTFMQKAGDAYNNSISLIAKNSKAIIAIIIILIILTIIAAIIMFFRNMRNKKLDEARKLIVQSSRRKPARK